MSSDFDPYHKWLGISPREQPPNHYRLLAIDLFEDDKEVIDASANRQMSYLQELASGPNLKQAQKLLNEVAAARVCLLDAERKADYDGKLRHHFSPSPPATGAHVGQQHDSTGPLAADNPNAGAAAPPMVVTPIPAAPSSAAIPPPPPSASPVPSVAQQTVGPKIRPIAPQDRIQRSGAHSTSRGKKKNPHVAIAVSLAAVLVVGVLGAILYARSHGTDLDTSELNSESPSSDGEDFPSVTWDGPSGRSSTHAQDTNSQGSDIPLPGANRNSDGAPPPPETSKPALKPLDKPSDAGSIDKALAAMRNRDIDKMKAELEKYLASNPQSARASEARDLLRQAELATSEDQVSNLVMNSLERHTVEEVREIMRNGRIELSIPINNRVLLEVFFQTLQRVQTRVFNERLAMGDGKKQDSGSTKPGSEPPKSRTDPKPPKPEATPKPGPEITDPSQLLASLGLVQDGLLWHLRDEDAMQEQVTEVAALYKKLNDARREISTGQRGQLVQLQRKLETDAARAKAMKDSAIQRQVISRQEAIAIEKAEAAVNALRSRIQSAEAKVSQVDRKINETRSQVVQQLDGLEKAVGTLDNRYRDLQTDDKALDAIEKLGGRLGRTSIVGTAKTKLKRMKDALADGP